MATYLVEYTLHQASATERDAIEEVLESTGVRVADMETAWEVTINRSPPPTAERLHSVLVDTFRSNGSFSPRFSLDLMVVRIQGPVHNVASISLNNEVAHRVV